MALLSRERAPIAVYGATGYTGRLVAAELEASGADFVLSGRDETKLSALAEELGTSAPLRAVSIDDPEGLRELLVDCSVVIDCAGPFSLYGEPVLSAAVDTSTHYLDTTGEQPYIRMAYERYGEAAKDAGVAVVPGMGFDYVPGDMIAALTAEGMGELDDVILAYRTNFQPTRGTTKSALEMIKGGDVEWRKLELRPASQSVSRGSFDFGEPIGTKRMTRYPAGEHLTVPRHVPTRRVQTMLSADSLVPTPLAPLMPALFRPAGIAMRTPAKGVVSALVSRMPEGASPKARAEATWTIVCEVRRGKKIRRGMISGRDVYGLTAALITKGARIASGRGFSGRGGLAPSQAFEPRSFLEGFDGFSLEWQVEPPAERENGH